MDRYAVIGHPVAHSLSPRIHAAFAAATSQVMSYEKLPAPRDGFARVAERFFAEGGSGLNVTVPFKEEAARWVDVLHPAAGEAGAVNTITREKGHTHGYNTDGAGLVRDLVSNCGEVLAGARILLLGAGGAARGVAGPLLDQRPCRLVIANRTGARAAALAGTLRQRRWNVPVEAAALSAVADGFDLVINATSAGLDGAGLPEVRADSVASACCYDLMYAGPGATDTAFCRWAAASRARRVLDGLGMLVEQAALAFELWRGVLPATRPVLELLRAPGV